MLLSGNEDALNPVVEAIHRLVDEVGEGGHEDGNLHKLTMELVLLALGDSLLGGPLSMSLGLDRGAGREIAAERLAQSFAAWQAADQRMHPFSSAQFQTMAGKVVQCMGGRLN